jgi:hypothetical protein
MQHQCSTARANTSAVLLGPTSCEASNLAAMHGCPILPSLAACCGTKPRYSSSAGLSTYKMCSRPCDCAGVQLGAVVCCPCREQAAEAAAAAAAQQEAEAAAASSSMAAGSMGSFGGPPAVPALDTAAAAAAAAGGASQPPTRPGSAVVGSKAASRAVRTSTAATGSPGRSVKPTASVRGH